MTAVGGAWSGEDGTRRKVLWLTLPAETPPYTLFWKLKNWELAKLGDMGSSNLAVTAPVGPRKDCQKVR